MKKSKSGKPLSEKKLAQLNTLRLIATKHGLRNSRVYDVWVHMKARCLNKKASSYLRYGGRGITVCDRWMKFENFIHDMGIPKPGLVLERIDNNRGYEPLNCKWATLIEQNNNRRNNVIVQYQGVKKPVSEWCRELGLNAKRVRQRLSRYKWTVEQAFECPAWTRIKKGQI